jgi:hypothetical protein
MRNSTWIAGTAKACLLKPSLKRGHITTLLSVCQTASHSIES